MTAHTWCNTARRRTRGRSKVTVYECRVCETSVEVLDCELAVEAAEAKKIEPDCDLVVVREIMSA